MLAPGWWRYCCRVGRCVVTNVGPTQESDLHVSVYADGEVSQVGSRVELFEEIRHDRRSEGLSIRELAERHKVHRRAVRHFGRVPGRIRYDNLKPAVTRILKGRNRDETERFMALRSHYLLTELI